MEEKIYFTPGMRVCLKLDIPNAPIMLVLEKKSLMFRNNQDKTLKGILCRWFTKDGMVQEAIFNTKDLKIV